MPPDAPRYAQLSTEPVSLTAVLSTYAAATTATAAVLPAAAGGDADGLPRTTSSSGVESEFQNLRGLIKTSHSRCVPVVRNTKLVVLACNLLELRNLLVDALLEFLVKLGPIPDREQQLKVDEERRQDHS